MISSSKRFRSFAAPGILRDFRKTDVTVCIPAYQAADFIDRTLRCAQGQTHGQLRIVVSVDRSTDETADICRAFAAADSRIEVLQQDERLGWCGNVNALLDIVDTRFFFIYFHDDLILPQYCERLRGTLMERPDCASANCDLFDFGMTERLRPGRAYEGSVAERILTLWGAPERGTPLRSMVCRDKVGPDFRLPQAEKDSLTPGQTLLVRMVAAGPAARVPETLYLRWQRDGGLTGGWRKMSYEQVFAGLQADAARVFSLVDELVPDPADGEILKIAQTLYVLRWLAGKCRKEGLRLPAPSEIHPDSPGIDIPDRIERFGPEITARLKAVRQEIETAYSELP